VKSIVVFVLMICSTAPVWAQSAGTGALAGTVTDPTGAVIPGVTVTATHTGTGLERTATSREDGSYRFSLLPPGTYKVKFVNPGFKPLEVPAVTVNVEQTAVLNHVLEVGGQTDVVQVEAQAEVLQTATSTLQAISGNGSAAPAAVPVSSTRARFAMRHWFRFRLPAPRISEIPGRHSPGSRPVQFGPCAE